MPLPTRLIHPELVNYQKIVLLRMLPVPQDVRAHLHGGRLHEQWEQLALALNDFLLTARGGRKADETTVDIVTHVKSEITLVGFWGSTHKQRRSGGCVTPG